MRNPSPSVLGWCKQATRISFNKPSKSTHKRSLRFLNTTKFPSTTIASLVCKREPMVCKLFDLLILSSFSFLSYIYITAVIKNRNGLLNNSFSLSRHFLFFPFCFVFIDKSSLCFKTLTLRFARTSLRSLVQSNLYINPYLKPTIIIL